MPVATTPFSTPNLLKTRSARKSLGKMSYARFLEWDGENQHVEWVDGEVYPMAPVSNEHQFIVNFIVQIIHEYCKYTDEGVVLSDPFQMKTGPSLPGRAPDVLFVAKGNLHRLKRNHLNGPADLVVEVISPGTGATDRGAKFDEYEKGGVKEYWIIDPDRKQAVFYHRNRKGHYEPIEIESGSMRSKVFKKFHLKIDWLWKRPFPKMIAILGSGSV